MVSAFPVEVRINEPTDWTLIGMKILEVLTDSAARAS
jgi:hypothetical protein